MSNFEEPPCKKRKEEEPSPSSSPVPRLPDDVALMCLAQVSRTEHAALSLLSKSYRSLVASPELYKIRSLMGRTETYIYVCLRTTTQDPHPRWFILRRRKTSSDLIPIPSFPCQPPEGSSVVAVDWGIYVIGGLIKGNPTSDVFLLDCRTHTWRRVTSMGVARSRAACGVVDGKIYVLGGCKFDDYSLSYGEVFDTKTQTWDCLPQMQDRKKRYQSIHDCVVRDGKVYAVDGTDSTFYYSPSEGKWGIGNRGEVCGSRMDWCVIDDLIFSCSKSGKIFWCEQQALDRREPEGMYWWNWKEVKGLGGLNGKLSRSRLVHFGEQILNMWKEIKECNIKFGGIPKTKKKKFGGIRELADMFPGARLSTSGGNIVLFWDEVLGDSLQIWFAEISLERCHQGKIRGHIERSHAVLTVDPFLDRYKVLYSVSVTL